MDGRTTMAVEAYTKAAMAVRRAEKLDRELKAALAAMPTDVYGSSEWAEYYAATAEVDDRIAALP